MPQACMTNLKKLYAPLSNLTQDGIKGLDLVELDIYGCGGINDLSWMKNLKILNISNENEDENPFDNGNKICEDGLRGLDLIELNIRYNKFIKDISWMSSLKKLEAHPCKLTQEGIMGLNLIELNLYSEEIKDISWMS